MATLNLRGRARQAPDQPNFNQNRLGGILLAILAILAAVVLLAVNPSLLVALSSNREGQALLQTATLAPGATAQGNLMLANEGLLPLDYSVRVRAGEEELHSNVILRLRRNRAQNYFYQGPLTDKPIAISRLLPGQHDEIEVVLWAPPSNSTASIPVDDTFTWTGRSPGLDYWWWLLVIALIVAAGAFAGPRALALWARIKKIPPLPFELYWRLPLILAILLVAALVPLTGVSLASVNAQSENPANVFAVGTLALSDRSPSGTTCISVPTRAGVAGLINHCDAIFNFNRMGPGSSGRALVTIRNLGTTQVAGFHLWSDQCISSADPTAPVHGSADICSQVLMTVHDDTHNFCYFPVQTGGECPIQAGLGSVAAFATAFNKTTPANLSSDGLGTGIIYSFGLRIDPEAGNDSQGRQLQNTFYWEIVSK